MNKDAILASVIGFGIGLIITGGVIMGPKLYEKIRTSRNQGQVASSSQDKTVETTPDIKNPDTTELAIENPKPESIVTEDTITLSGKRSKNAVVIITGPLDETVVGPQENSTFEGKITLKEGKNDITVAQVIEKSATTQMLTVYYSKAAN